MFSPGSVPYTSEQIAKPKLIYARQSEVHHYGQILIFVLGRDVYIIQSGTKDVNNDIMELLILAYASKSASARKVVAVVPYLPYSKQSKVRKRGAIICKLVANMLCSAGINHVITVDLHSKEIQGFFDVPVDNLRASPFLIKYIETYVLDYRNAVIVARDPSVVPRATSYAERLRLPLAVIHGEDRDELEHNDGRNSPPLENLQVEKRLASTYGFYVKRARPKVICILTLHFGSLLFRCP
ncbi:unnamed protein product [Calicophoron daubneyi]|uniref:Ribose-phosphate pyrophosphokinase N-terminal domain-containing protein n=1 Tax=Calicophoron daubneyi TaxID=300641 RepID=A0AAV2TNR7_CALDB